MNDFDEKYVKNLYKFNKNELKKPSSKKKEIENIQSVHQWLRKVEEASETAINNVLAKDKATTNQAKSSKNIKNEPCSEAHDLINQWVTDKIRFDMDDDFYNYVDVGEMNLFNKNEKVLNEIKAELLSDDDILDIKGVDYDKYDENYITKDIINKMMKKKIVDGKTLLYMDEKKAKPIDLKTKIELRHQAVKENREKRLRELEMKRKERLEKKEIELRAKQIIEKEDRDKKQRENIEQQLLEQEVQRLRIEMAEQRQREDEMRKKQREMELIKSERERQELLNIQKKLELSNIENAMEAKRSEMAEKRAQDLVNTYLKAKSMRICQVIFSSWYGLVLDSRLKAGKAKALADWKLSYKVFNSWKKVSITQKVKKEQELHQNQVIHENVRLVKASNFYHTKLIRKCFDVWTKFTRNEKFQKHIEEEKQKKKNKMQKFLEAIENDEQEQTALPETTRLTARSARSNKSHLSNLRKSKSFDDVNEHDGSSSATQQDTKPKPKTQRPTKSYMPNKLNTERNQTPKAEISDTELTKKVKEMIWPLVKSPFTVNNFESRFKAQEKLLKEQHEMIKEQQRTIEEMKFQQGQAAFKEQIALLEQIKSKQLELEQMQKHQYKQEKILLRQKESLRRAQKSVNSKRTSSTHEENSTILESELENLELLDMENESDEQLNEDKTLSERKNITDREIDDTNRTSSPLNSNTTNRSNVKLNSFMKNMEERQKMREQMKKEREEKRKKQELEKLELLRAQQEEKLKLEEEERKRKAEEIKEKKRMQRELDEKRNAEKIKEQQLLSKADNFYKKYLLRYYGMNGFKKLIAMRNENVAKAQQLYSLKMYKQVIDLWQLAIRDDLVRRQQLADRYNRNLLLKTYFNYMKQSKQCIQIEMAKAGRFYKYNIKLKLFLAWKTYTTHEKRKTIEYESIVEEHNKNRIIQTYFKIWKEFPAEIKRSRARQKRIEELRSKVKAMLPDYEVPVSSQEKISI